MHEAVLVYSWLIRLLDRLLSPVYMGVVPEVEPNPDSDHLM